MPPMTLPPVLTLILGHNVLPHHACVATMQLLLDMLSLSSLHAYVLVDRHEEEVQPFQEAVAGNESASWAYLQKTYSNTEEAAQGISQGQGDHSQEGRPMAMPSNVAALPVQVSKPV